MLRHIFSPVVCCPLPYLPYTWLDDGQWLTIDWITCKRFIYSLRLELIHHFICQRYFIVGSRPVGVAQSALWNWSKSGPDRTEAGRELEIRQAAAAVAVAAYSNHRRPIHAVMVRGDVYSRVGGEYVLYSVHTVIQSYGVGRERGREGRETGTVLVFTYRSLMASSGS